MDATHSPTAVSPRPPHNTQRCIKQRQSVRRVCVCLSVCLSIRSMLQCLPSVRSAFPPGRRGPSPRLSQRFSSMQLSRVINQLFFGQCRDLPKSTPLLSSRRKIENGSNTAWVEYSRRMSCETCVTRCRTRRWAQSSPLVVCWPSDD